MKVDPGQGEGAGSRVEPFRDKLRRIDGMAGKGPETNNEQRFPQCVRPKAETICSTARFGDSAPSATFLSIAGSIARTAGLPRSLA